MSRRLLLFTLAPACGFAALAATAAVASGALLVNESPSLPEGLYRRTGAAALPRLGDVVALEPPAGARAYLTRLGMPASVKLLKRVGAQGGQAVCATPGALRLKDRELRVRARDRQGVTLPRWADCRPLERDEIFVVGDSADSFDSRYFGPVRHGAVSGVYREVLTW